jgi:hypothetical protein
LLVIDKQVNIDPDRAIIFKFLLNTGNRSVDELNGKMIACQILLTGLIAKVANSSPDPLRFLTDFRDEVRAVINQIRIAGPADSTQVRQTARATVDELFGLMKPPSTETADGAQSI